jgi:hypothetical protein
MEMSSSQYNLRVCESTKKRFMTDNLQEWHEMYHTPKSSRYNHYYYGGSSGKSRRGGKRSSSQKRSSAYHISNVDNFFIRPKKIDFLEEAEKLYKAQKYFHFR